MIEGERRGEQGEERLRVETGLALVGELIDRSEGSDINLDFLLRLAVLQKDDTAEDAQAVRRRVLVEFEHLDGGANGSFDGLACLSRLNVGRARDLLIQELRVLHDGIARWDVQ